MAENETQDTDLNSDADLDVEEIDDAGSEGASDSKPAKPAETDDARLTRLTRQTNQQRKKMGLAPLTEGQVAKQAEEKSNNSKPSDDLDYGQKALLRAMGIKGPDEHQLAKDFMKRTGQDIDSLESDDIFQAKLEKLRTTKANEAAAATGNRRGNAQSSNTVDAILAKLGPNDPIPNDLPRDVREKLVDARFKKGETSKQFYND